MCLNKQVQTSGLGILYTPPLTLLRMTGTVLSLSGNREDETHPAVTDGIIVSTKSVYVRWRMWVENDAIFSTDPAGFGML